MKRVEVVGAVILNDFNQVLCALRSKDMSLSGMWEFPGGKVETGESHQQTLTREIREELSCEVSAGDFITECLYEYPSITVHLHTYYARLKAGTPIPQEHARLEWVRYTDLEELNWAPADLPTVKKVIADFSKPQEPKLQSDLIQSET